MKNIYLRILLISSLLLAGVSSYAQTNFFNDVRETDIKDTTKRVIIPSKYRLIHLDTTALLNFLQSIPGKKITADHSNAPVIEIPMPDGSLAKFYLWQTPVMDAALAAKYPGIITYTGQGIDDRSATIKIDWSALGFHAMILSPVTTSVFIDPYQQGNKSYYIAYFRSDLANREAFTEDTPPVNNAVHLARPASSLGFEPSSSCIGGQLRSYRLAVACTHQYAIAATGLANPTVAQTLSAVVTVINRVDGVYEEELDIHFNLIAKEDTILFNNAGIDPFTGNNNGNVLIFQSQSVIDSYIGDANYDIGHTFSTGAGGLSEIGVVCLSGDKASSVTGLSNPVGDPYAIDYVSHEIGHEFGANHSFNSIIGGCGASGQFSSISNSEPGSGSTIMCYAGGPVANDSALCGKDNLQVHSDPDFNALGFDEITDYSINGSGNSCPTITATGNTAPVVNAGLDYIIPLATPFVLTGSATDIDGDILTYSWEQVNIGGPGGPWNTPSGDAPIFRSFPPVTSPSRYFPKLSDVVNNTTTIGELLPTYARVMNFRLTVRDNHAGSGGVCNDQNIVTVDGSSGPFKVTYPNSANITWNVDDTKTITWDTAGTQSSPVGCSNVTIELSTDGGLTYPDTILASTPNIGTAQIIVPNNITTTARIRVMAAGNIFYDISDNNFTINPSGITEVWNVYPNPTANHMVTIVSNKSDTYIQLSLFDDIGRLLLTQSISNSALGQNIPVSFGNVAKGVYMLKIKTNNGLTAKKIVVR
jgi:hypothetical protein